MNRSIYETDGVISLAEYVPETDDTASYEAWQDSATIRGYNHRINCTFDEFAALPDRCRFHAAILRHADDALIGEISISPETSLPDLAIILYPGYRGQGYGTAAFRLGVRYALHTLKLPCLYAGCYEGNAASRRMLEKCGFVPHPEGDVPEKDVFTGEDIIQHDFVVYPD